MADGIGIVKQGKGAEEYCWNYAAASTGYVPAGCSARFMEGIFGDPKDLSDRAKKMGAVGGMETGTPIICSTTYVTNDKLMEKAGFTKVAEFQSVHGKYMLGLYVRKDEGKLVIPDAKEVIKEVIKEVPVEKIVEKVVYRDRVKKVASKTVKKLGLRKRRIAA